MIVLTNIPASDGVPRYHVWAKDFATYLGEGFVFDSQERHPIGVLLKFKNDALFYEGSIFGDSLNLLIKITEDKTAGEIVQVYINPLNSVIPDAYAQISAVQFVEKCGLAMGVHYYLLTLIDFFIRNYLIAFENKGIYNASTVIQNGNNFDLHLHKNLESHDDIMSWNIDTFVKNPPMVNLIESLNRFGFSEILDKRSVAIRIEGSGARRIGEFKFCFQIPRFLRELVY